MRLTRLREKLELLRGQGVDVVLCLAFNRRLRELSAAEFVRQVLVDGLAVRHLEVGDDFRFGCDRSGDFAFLVNASREQGFTVEAATTVELDGVRVKQHAGPPGPGRGRPASRRAPSGASLQPERTGPAWTETRPATGLAHGQHSTETAQGAVERVYLVSTLVDGQRCQEVANIGTRPSVNGDGRPHLEVHLLDFAGDLYGRHLQVTFHQKLRDEQRFASLEALKAAILADIAAARAYWLGQPLD